MMNTALYLALLVAALVFITVSAAMNALFLSSLGRSPIEMALLTFVSVAADIVKAVLPVVVFRAVLLRAWVQAGCALVMLVGVVALSLTSGIGFAAMTRAATLASHDAQGEQLGAERQALRETENQISALGQVRPASVIEAELAGLENDRRWTMTGSCRELGSSSARTFCTGVSKLRQELATSKARAEFAAARQASLDRIAALQSRGAGEASDPQSSAIAELLGIDRAAPRVIVTSYIAAILELGSILLILLAAGPAMRGWREPGNVPIVPAVAAELPLPADRAQWRRQREKGSLETSARTLGHARQ